MPVDDQIVLKERFNALISEAVNGVAQADRIILDTGDGAALALLGAPEEALFVALTIRDGALRDQQEHPERFFTVRIGVNLGPVRVVNDLNGMLNVVGDGINAAQRIMSFAQPNRILVSRSYFEIASRLNAEIAAMFSYYGVKTDKYVREHEVYIVLDGQQDEEAPLAAPATVGAAWESGFAAMRKYWMPISAGAACLAIAWGVWVGMSSTWPKDQASTATAAGSAAGKLSSGKTTAADHQSETTAASGAEDGGTHATQGQPSQSKPKRVKRQPASTCSDAERMLKQCN